MRQNQTGRRTVLFKTRGGCTPIPGIDRPGYDCARFVADGFKLADRSDIRTVVISASWVGFTDRKDYFKAGDFSGPPLKMLTPQTEWVLDGFESEIAHLVAAGKQVVVVLSSPFGEQFDPRKMAHRDGLDFKVSLPSAGVPRRTLDKETAFIDDPIRQIAARAGATVISPLDTLCIGDECPALDGDGKPILRDYSHLRSSFVSHYFNAFDHFVVPVSPLRHTNAATGPR
jgi:hypothetical protein